MIKSDNSIKKISLNCILSLIPLILFGFYKNGITLYIKDYVGILGMFKPLLFIIIGAILGIGVNIIYDKLILKSNNKLIDSIFSSFHLIYGILIACISSINTNLLLYTSFSLKLILLGHR